MKIQIFETAQNEYECFSQCKTSIVRNYLICSWLLQSFDSYFDECTKIRWLQNTQLMTWSDVIVFDRNGSTQTKFFFLLTHLLIAHTHCSTWHRRFECMCSFGIFSTENWKEKRKNTTNGTCAITQIRQTNADGLIGACELTLKLKCFTCSRIQSSQLKWYKYK